MIALALGKTVREIEETMPATELAEWVLFYGEHPFGDFRADLRSGIIASTIARYGGSKDAKPSDYMPVFKEKSAAGARASAAAREAASVHNAVMKASAKLRHRIIRRKG